MSENQIRKTLNQMQVSLLKQGDNQFYLRSKTTTDQEIINKLLKIKSLPDLMPIDSIQKYL